MALLIIFFLIVIITPNKQKIKILTIPKNTNLLCENNEINFTINLYSNKKDNKYFYTNLISNIALKAKNDLFRVELVSLTLSESSEKIDDEVYFNFKLNLNLPLLIEDIFILKDVKLTISYLNDETIELLLGNYCITKSGNSLDLGIVNLKGIINKFENIKTLVGITIKLHNRLPSDVIIKDIKLLNSVCTIQDENMKFIRDSDIDIFENMTTLIGKYYSPFFKSKDRFKAFSLLSNETKTFILPLSYNNIEKVSESGFVITYEVDGIINRYVFENFTFFKNRFEDKAVSIFETNSN